MILTLLIAAGVLTLVLILMTLDGGIENAIGIRSVGLLIITLVLAATAIQITETLS